MQSTRFYITFAVLGLLITGACQGAPQQDLAIKAPLTPLPELVDPNDFQLQQSVLATLKTMGAPMHSNYDYRRIDLNDDGRRDALVLFKTPYGFWCDKHGCTMLVMEAHNDKFTLVNSIQPVRPPIYSTANQTNGWKDIIIRVSGRWKSAKNVSAKYDGREYPLDPSRIEPAAGYEIADKEYLCR